MSTNARYLLTSSASRIQASVFICISWLDAHNIVCNHPSDQHRQYRSIDLITRSRTPEPGTTRHMPLSCTGSAYSLTGVNHGGGMRPFSHYSVLHPMVRLGSMHKTTLEHNLHTCERCPSSSKEAEKKHAWALAGEQDFVTLVCLPAAEKRNIPASNIRFPV